MAKVPSSGEALAPVVLIGQRLGRVRLPLTSAGGVRANSGSARKRSEPHVGRGRAESGPFHAILAVLRNGHRDHVRNGPVLAERDGRV
jgi:hypothetical protein